MIKYLRSALRKNLSLLILSLLLIPAKGVTQETDTELELPEVYIYGTHLGKIQLSAKKDFFPYLSRGNLYPHAKPLSPELRFPLFRQTPHQRAPVQQYWLLLDAGAGNWWSDRVFLDCGLRNQQGLLSFRWSDFRRKNWWEGHSHSDDLFLLKGAYGKENYYITANALYEYEKRTRGMLSPLDTVTTKEGGIELLTSLDLHPLLFPLEGNALFFSRTPLFLSGTGIGITLSENRYEISAYPLLLANHFDVLGNFSLEHLTSESSGEDFSSTVSTIGISLRKVLATVSIAPGIAVFSHNDEFTLAPLATVKVAMADYPLYAFMHYGEEHAVNSYRNISAQFPFVSVPIDDYSILETKKAVAGVEGQWHWVNFYTAYKHLECKHYPILPLMPVTSGVLYADISKDVVEVLLEVPFEDFRINANGEVGFHDKIPHEPGAVVHLGSSYNGLSPLVLFSGIEGSFGIRTTATRTIDILSLNGGIEYSLLENLVLRFEAENIFDDRYEVWPGYTEGAIQFNASLKYRILQ